VEKHNLISKHFLFLSTEGFFILKVDFKKQILLNVVFEKINQYFFCIWLALMLHTGNPLAMLPRTVCTVLLVMRQS
jgi:hypothetical protein